MENKYNLPEVSEDKQVHLQRYLRLIETRPLRDLKRNGKLYNIHHILPRGLGGLDSKENLIKLTHREHFIAHLILYKAYEDKMAYAFCYISKKGKITNSKIYENAIKYIKSSEIQINNGIKNMTVYNIKDIPEGFVIGRFTSQRTRYARKIKMKEKIWITNGSENCRIEKNENIPEGFIQGKTEFSKCKRDHASGKKWINNGIHNKYINIDEQIPKGFSLGFINKPKKERKDKDKKHIWINNGFDNKFIIEEDFYLYSGFKLGRVKKCLE